MELWMLEEAASNGGDFPLHIEILVQHAEPMKVRILQLRLWGLAVHAPSIYVVAEDAHVAEPVSIVHLNQLEVPAIVERIFKFPCHMRNVSNAFRLVSDVQCFHVVCKKEVPHALLWGTIF